MSALELAPEAVEGVQAARVALQEEAARLTATGDPLAPAVSVLARAGEATNRLLVDVFLKTQATHEATGKLIQEGRKPWTRDETRMLVTQLDQTLLHRWAQFNRAGIAIGVGVALLFGAVCGVGYRLNKRRDPMFFVRLILGMLVFGTGRSAVFAQQHGQNDWFATAVALLALFALLALLPRRRRIEARK